MARFQNPPIERHEALAPLSRDHYSGLVLARHLIKAAAGDAVARRQAVAEFVDSWDREVAEHFADEERLLTALMADADRERLLAEHRALRALAERARAARRSVDPDAELVGEIGGTLERHIRWEERELFVRLQERLTPGQLAALGAQTAPIEDTRPRRACRRGGPGPGEAST